MDAEVVKQLKVRYANVHPLIFYRSIERANSPGEAFDILESIPKEMPILWGAKERRWINTVDITQASEMQFPDIPVQQ